MSSITLRKLIFSLFTLFTICCFQAFAQAPVSIPAASNAEPQPNKALTADYLQEAAKSSIFVYDGNTQPCEPPADPSKALIPLGSGFVIGITDGNAQPKPGEWRGWKFLVTARHVIKDSVGTIVLRLNQSGNEEAIKCFPLTLKFEGDGQNTFALPDEDPADVMAVLLPEMPGTDPTVFMPSMLLEPEKMKTSDIKVGTNVFTVGYFYGYAGEKQNYPITKYGKISILTSEKWYSNPDFHRQEQGYVVELQNTPGLSGAPVMTYGQEFHLQPFQFRNLPPFVLGIVKGLELVPVAVAPNRFVLISQGVATVEPASNIRKLMEQIATLIKKAGGNPLLN